MWSAKNAHEVAKMSAVAAGEYVRKMGDREIERAGSRDRAFDAIARRYGLTRSQIRHLRDGRAKTVEAGLFQRIRLAYLDFCERQIRALEHELAVERAMTNDTDAALDRAEGTLRQLQAANAQAKAEARSRSSNH